MEDFVDVCFNFDAKTLKAVEDFAKKQGMEFDEAVVYLIDVFYEHIKNSKENK